MKRYGGSRTGRHTNRSEAELRGRARMNVVHPGCLLVGLVGAFAIAGVACGQGEGADARSGGAAVAELRSSGAAEATQDTMTANAVLSGEGGLRVSRIRVAGIPVTAEIADDDQSRERGLMFRDTLPPDHGMLFVYETERRLGFWMHNTRLPLDIGFIDRSGHIVDIQQMEPMTDTTHTSRAPAMYALEMPQGWFEKHHVKVGDPVEF